MFWLFGMVLPLEGAQNKEVIKNTFGHGIEEIIPDLMIILSQYCERNPEQFESYLQFFIEAIAYMTEETNKHPEIDMDYEEYQRAMKI